MSREADGTPSSKNASTMNVSMSTRTRQGTHRKGRRKNGRRLCKMQKAKPHVSERHKVYLTIARKVTTNHEATTMGIILGIKPYDVSYYLANYDVRDAAYRFLSWPEDNCGPVEKWEKIVEAMKVLEKNATVKELVLEERLTAAKRRMSVQNSVDQQNRSERGQPMRL